MYAISDHKVYVIPDGENLMYCIRLMVLIIPSSITLSSSISNCQSSDTLATLFTFRRGKNSEKFKRQTESSMFHVHRYIRRPGQMTQPVSGFTIYIHFTPVRYFDYSCTSNGITFDISLHIIVIYILSPIMEYTTCDSVMVTNVDGLCM